MGYLSILFLLITESESAIVITTAMMTELTLKKDFQRGNDDAGCHIGCCGSQAVDNDGGHDYDEAYDSIYGGASDIDDLKKEVMMPRVILGVAVPKLLIVMVVMIMIKHICIYHI